MKRPHDNTRPDDNRQDTEGRRQGPSLGGCSVCSGGAFGETANKAAER